MTKHNKKHVFFEDLHFGIQRYEIHKPWSYPKHGHEGYSEFLYISKGEMVVPLSASRLQLKEGDLVLLRESDVHSLKSSSVLFYNVNFLYEDLISLAKLVDSVDVVKSFYKLDVAPVFKIAGFGKIEIDNQLKLLFDYQRDVHGNTLLMKYLMTLLVDITKDIKYEPIYNESPPKWFIETIEHIEHHIVEIHSVLDLAHLSDKSSEHLSRSFKKFLGMTPSSYLNQIRLEKASLRLTSSNDEIISISMDFGFQNLNYFYKLFKEKYGIPPKEYRKKNGLSL
ncbi:MAG: hypothetical protein COA79_10150 [Planctomycetota bacterium]|nr:MAG: hypothetical protein COA79_10150 [Planctomycetota bacterium]